MSIEVEPLVTVIAVCYNHSRFVVECLESIRQQSYPSIQLIIMDDCSKDDSVQIIRDWINRNQIECTFIPHQKNIGLPKTINEALGFARGEFISIIATDDVWLKDKTEHQIKIFKNASPTVGIVYSDADQIDPNGCLVKKGFIEDYRSFAKPPEGFIFPLFLRGNFIPAPSVLIRRSCYEKVGLYNEDIPYEDWDMWLRISQYYEFAFSDQTTTLYRVVPSSLVRTMSKQDWALSNSIIFKKLLASPGLLFKHRRRIKKNLTDIYWKQALFDQKNRLQHLRNAMKYSFFRTIKFIINQMVKGWEINH